MPILETSVQQRMIYQGIYQTQGNQKKLNSFNHEYHWNMILKDLKIFSQNAQKNNLIINSILEINYDFDIILIQELSWTTIRSIPSSENCEDIPLVGIPNHPNWLIFARESNSVNNSPRVTIYVNIRLSSFCFSLHKNIINHRDILLVLDHERLFWFFSLCLKVSQGFWGKYFKPSYHDWQF